LDTQPQGVYGGLSPYGNRKPVQPLRHQKDWVDDDPNILQEFVKRIGETKDNFVALSSFSDIFPTKTMAILAPIAPILHRPAGIGSVHPGHVRR